MAPAHGNLGDHALAPPMSDIEPTVPAFRRRNGRLSSWPAFVLALVLVAAVVGIPTAIISHDASAYFVFSPGTAPVITTSNKCRAVQGQLALPDGTPCVHLVVPRGKAHVVDGELMMVDVEVSQASPLDYVEYELGLLGRQRQFVPEVEYTGSAPASEVGCQEDQQMVSADQDAAVTALETLRYRVVEQPLGAQVTEVLGGTPAWDGGVKCNDLITAVNGRAVRTAADFEGVLAPLAPGTTVTLTDHPGSGGPVRRLAVHLGRPPASLVASGFTNRAYLGVAVGTSFKPVLPFPVSVNAGQIGGPSAGLAFTLAILDSLSNGQLTGGHRVAATGTIDTQGDVGDVGGVQEKTVAVEKAGAQVFFVPKDEYQDAKSEAGKDLEVVPVTTLNQVLDILQQRYGGNLSGLANNGRR
jgi:PDZ domain-containing protein